MSWLAAWFIFELIMVGAAPDLSEPQTFKIFLCKWWSIEHSLFIAHFTKNCTTFKFLTLDMTDQSGSGSGTLSLLPASAFTSLEKRIFWWNQDVKEAIRAKKDAFKALQQDRLSSDLQSRYTADVKSSNFESKEIHIEVMGKVWSAVGFQLLFGKQSILADYPSFLWQAIECHVLHQGFCRYHSNG